MATRVLTAFFTLAGAPETGLTPTVTVRKVSDNSVVVNAQSMSEIGDGWYKYSWSSYDDTEQYVVIYNAGTDTVDARYLYSESSVADVRAIHEKTTNLPSDPADQSQVEAAISTAESNIRGVDSDTLKSISDQIDALPATDEYTAALAAIQADLDNPNQYKADVSALATEANATTNTANIIAEIDANETKIDAMQGNVTDILADTDTMEADLKSYMDTKETNIIAEIDANEIKIDALPAVGEYSAALAAIQADLDNPNQYKADISALALEASVQAVKSKTDNLPADPASQSAITSAISVSESAIRGSDSDDLKALSDQMDAAQSDLDNPNQYKADVSGLALEASVQDVKVKTDNLPVDPAAESNATLNRTQILNAIPSAADIDSELSSTHGSSSWEGESADVADLALESTAQAIKAKTDNLPADPTSETQATANKDEIIGEINDNESLLSTIDGNVVQIRAKTDLIPANFSTVLDNITEMLSRVLGLVHDNIVVDDYEYDVADNHTDCVAYIYDSKTNAELHDKITGLLYKYTLSVGIDGFNRVNLHRMVREL